MLVIGQGSADFCALRDCNLHARIRTSDLRLTFNLTSAESFTSLQRFKVKSTRVKEERFFGLDGTSQVLLPGQLTSTGSQPVWRDSLVCLNLMRMHRPCRGRGVSTVILVLKD